MSTRAQRRIRQAVMERDGYRCQRIVHGFPCGAPATDAGHILAHHHGGSYTPDNLQAECTYHNRGDGPRIAASRPPTRRTWTWA